jgi:hypothetical protein
MGFWGKLGKAFSVLGPIAASFVPGGAAVSTGLKLLKGGLTVGGLAAGGIAAGKGIAKDLKQEDENTKQLSEQGTKLFGQANPAFAQALDTQGKLAAGDKGTLASFTGTGVDDLNRAESNQIKRAKSTMSRGGAQAKVLAEAPGELERSALALRSNVRSTALDKLGTLGLAGSQAGNEALGGAERLELTRRGQNIGIGKDIGEGVGTILDKAGVWGKLGKTMGGIFGGDKTAGGDGPFKELPVPGMPEFSTGGFKGSELSLPSPNINLDLFGGKKNESDSGSWGQMFSGN